MFTIGVAIGNISSGLFGFNGELSGSVCSDRTSDKKHGCKHIAVLAGPPGNPDADDVMIHNACNVLKEHP